MGCFSGRLMSAASDQKLFCKLFSPLYCSFDEFVGEKVISLSYSSAVLTPPLSLSLVFSFSPLYYLLLPSSLYVAWFAVLFIQVLFTLNLSVLFYSSGLSPPSFSRNFSKKLIFLFLVLPSLIYYQRDISEMQI